MTAKKILHLFCVFTFLIMSINLGGCGKRAGLQPPDPEAEDGLQRPYPPD